VATDDCAGRAEQAGAVELQQLRHQAIAQARELAIIRWEIANLGLMRSIRGPTTGLKHFLLQKFPKLMHRAAYAKRRVDGLMQGSMERQIPVENATMLLVDRSPTAMKIAARIGSRCVISVSPGAGLTRSLSVPQPGEAPLRAPLQGSLVEWLIKDPTKLRQVRTVVVEAGDDISLSLLRGRLMVGQRLVLTHSTGIMSSFVAELGNPEDEEAGATSYSQLPTSWLDPLDQNLGCNPAIANQRQWPKISVVMVSFNQADFLEEGIQSVLDQGYPNLEFVVIDGKSTDGSVKILEKYQSRLACLVIEPDKGQSDGLNKGFARATGDILTWLNSDDLLERGSLFRVAQAFTAHAVDMVAGGCRQIGLTRSDVILNHQNKLPYGTPVTLPLGLLLEMERFWLTGSFFYQPEVFFSRDIWARSGGGLRTDLNYILDYDLWVRMAAAGATILHIPDFLACSRTHEQQKTRAGLPFIPEVQRLLREYGGRLVRPSA
jgi:hypothetical protein